MEATSGTHTSLPARRSRRRWSHAEKLELLEMAQASSISSVAKQNNINPSLMFTWRAELNSTESCLPKADDHRSLADWYRHSLAGIATFSSKAGALVVQSFLSDLQARRISSYNGVMAYAALVGAYCKLSSQQIVLAEKLMALPPPPDEAKEQENRKIDENVARISEQILMALAAGHISTDDGEQEKE